MYRNDRGEYRKRRKKHHIFLWICLIGALVFIIHLKFALPKALPSYFQSSSEINSETTGESSVVSEETVQALEAMAGKEPKVMEILNHPDRYPKRLLESLSRNPELLDFTLDYPEKKGSSSNNIDLSDKYQPGQIPLLIQWDEDWGYAAYGDGIIALDGCGPTCLSMVAVRLTGDSSLNPKAVAEFSEKDGYLDAKTNSTLWTLMTEGAKKLGLNSHEIPLNETRMARELSQGHLIICSLFPGDFTAVGHFIVLYDYKDGKFSIRDPNSKIRSGETWSYETLRPQIRNLWVFSS